MARLCILMSLLTFGLSFVPKLIQLGAQPAATTPGGDATSELEACADAARLCAVDCRDLGHADCARLCQACHHACLVCESLEGSTSTASLEAYAAHRLLLGECQQACERVDTPAAAKCASACRACLALQCFAQ